MILNLVIPCEQTSPIILSVLNDNLKDPYTTVLRGD